MTTRSKRVARALAIYRLTEAEPPALPLELRIEQRAVLCVVIDQMTETERGHYYAAVRRGTP